MIEKYSDVEKAQYFLLRAIEVGQLGQYLFLQLGCILLLFTYKMPLYFIFVIFIIMKFLWYPFAYKITNYKFACILPFIGVFGNLVCISVSIYMFIFAHKPILGVCALLWKWFFPLFGMLITSIVRIRPPQYGIIQNNLVYDYKHRAE